MDVGTPGGGLLDERVGSVLAALLDAEQGLTGRALSRITGVPQATVSRALRRLAGLGLVLEEPVPPATLYRINRDHLLLSGLRGLVSVQRELRQRVAGEVAAWRVPPDAVICYGSAVRGDGSVDSDIDLLIVRPNTVRPDDPSWELQVSDLSRLVTAWTGNRASVVEMGRREVSAGLRSGEPFLHNADEQGWPLTGVRLRDLATTTGASP
jgi:DNA-binding transcriptional ArsR family regulator